MSTCELIRWVVNLQERARNGSACWHEAEYYSFLLRLNIAARSIAT